jgi:DNA-binding response OmpR family regulator
VTTRGGGDDMVNGFEVGCNDYVTKPIHGPELLSKVRNLIGE